MLLKELLVAMGETELVVLPLPDHQLPTKREATISLTVTAGAGAILLVPQSVVDAAMKSAKAVTVLGKSLPRVLASKVESCYGTTLVSLPPQSTQP